MIFKNNFDNLTDEEIDLLDSYFNGYNYESSAHTLLANYIWRNTHNISWEVIGDYLMIASYGTLETEEKEYYISFPLTKTGTYDTESLKYTISETRKRFKEKGRNPEMSLIPGSLAHYLSDIYGDEVELIHERDDDDYIYLRSDLETLSGRKLHGKKNHLNQFLKTYDFTYEEITEDNVEEVWEYIQSKNAYKLGETPEEYKEILELENVAIKEMLKFKGLKDTDAVPSNSNYHPGILSGVIRVDNEIVACEIAEYQNTEKKDTVLVHVEKADDRLKGLYQAINNEFVKRLPPEVEYLNREEDMGLENLRNTKLSYKPYKMGEKYTCVFK